VSTASNVSGRDGNDIRGSLDLFRLGGRAALVTGAARGLGRAMALALADAGADIVAVDAAPLNDLANEIEKLGSGCVPLAADLSQLDPPAARDLVDRGKDTFPALDILVNNAGTIRRGPVLETTAQDWAAVIGLNLTTPFFLAQAFARVLVQHGRGGSIINRASLNSFQGGVEVPAYAASKHGLLGVTRAMANELSRKSIRVNAIAPGYMSTQFTAAHREDPARYEAMTARMPIGRWGVPEDLCGAVVYLASEASCYVTGTVLPVDGGWLAR
jgi:2-dehydro-3-deoxy-D-gluconate 5-dehydrogenase